MTLHVKVAAGGYQQKVSSRNLDRALFTMVSGQVHPDMNLYVPKRQNHLRDKSFVRGNKVTYMMPYAKAQFRGFIVTRSGKVVRIRNYSTPGTGRRWDLRAKANHMAAWRKAFIEGGCFNGS